MYRMFELVSFYFTLTDGVTEHLTLIRVYTATSNVDPEFASGICELEGAGYRPRIDTQAKLELYHTLSARPDYGLM